MNKILNEVMEELSKLSASYVEDCNEELNLSLKDILYGQVLGLKDAKEIVERELNKVNLQEAFLQEQIDENLEGVELTEQQKRMVYQGVSYWLQETLPEAISDAVGTAVLETTENRKE